MITTAAKEHTDGIKALWLEAFGGEAGYVDMFLRDGTKPENTLVYLQNDAVCGMLFILPCRLVFGAESYKCAYLYAVATGEKYRGQGISTALMQEAYDLCTVRGYDVCALVPADHGLFEFYAKRGYAIQGYVKMLTVSSDRFVGTDNPPVLTSITCGEIVAMREKAFGKAYLEWDRPEMRYIIAENKLLGGAFYKYWLNDRIGFLSCIPSENSLEVREFSGEPSALYVLAGGLCLMYGKDGCLFRLDIDCPVGTLTPFAMTRWINGAVDMPFYLSHVLE